MRIRPVTELRYDDTLGASDRTKGPYKILLSSITGSPPRNSSESLRISSFSSLVGAMAFMNQDSRNLYAIVRCSVWLVSYDLITSTSRYSNQLLRFVFQRPTVQLLSAKPYRQEPEIYCPSLRKICKPSSHNYGLSTHC